MFNIFKGAVRNGAWQKNRFGLLHLLVHSAAHSVPWLFNKALERKII